MRRATIYVVRHAKAGERRAWNGDDFERPLSKAGWQQAESIGKRLARHGATGAVSSPYVRCIQTLEPLAARLGIGVKPDDRLIEDVGFEGALELISDVDDGAVLCSHGDIIPAVIQALVRRGMEVQTAPDWRKATIWVLQRKGSRVTKGKVWPPPGRGRVG